MEVSSLLKTANIRATPKRVALLHALGKACEPLSAEILHARLKGADLVTVYRNLQAFVKAGIVQEVRFKDDIVRYEIAHTHHHHLVCTVCGVIEELQMCDAVPLEKSVLRRSRRFRSVSEHTLEFFGLCNTCA